MHISPSLKFWLSDSKQTRPFRRENLSYTCHPGVNLLIQGNESISPLPLRNVFAVILHTYTFDNFALPLYFLPLRIGGATSTAVPTSEEKAGIRIGGGGGEGINSARWVVAQCADLKVECKAPDGNRTRFETLSFVSSTPVLYCSIVFCYLSRTFAFFCFLEQSDVENSVVGLQN